MRRRWVLVLGSVLALGLAPAAWAERVVVQVYFDWEVTTVDKKATDTILASLTRIKACASNGIRIVGHADTSHTDAQSSELATARAKSVRDLLVKQGVKDSLIGVVGHSKNDLAVPTKDGVREPKNRRAEIILVCD